MLKTTALAALGLLTLSGAASAGDHPRTQAFQPSSPQALMDVVEAGGGTLTGTVGTVAAKSFVLSDGAKDIPVASHGFLADGIQAGDQITVVGSIRHGGIRADQIIRQDGTAFGRHESSDRPKPFQPQSGHEVL